MQTRAVEAAEAMEMMMIEKVAPSLIVSVLV